MSRRHKKTYYRSSRKKNARFLENSAPERLYYEVKPFICILAAFYCMKVSNLTGFGQMSAILLLVAGSLILVERAKYRGFIR